MAKVKEIGPPTPISPANMMPIFTSGASKPVEFSWTPMTNAVGYRLRISHNPYFSSTIVDRRVTTADVIVSGLGEGAYYWLVQSYDADDKESVESQKNRFTIIPKGQNTTAIDLELDPFMQHGKVIELTGKDRGRGPGDGEWQGSARGRRRWQLSLLHASAAAGREPDHDYGAECQGRSEYGPEEDRDSVGFSLRSLRPFLCVLSG